MSELASEPGGPEEVSDYEALAVDALFQPTTADEYARPDLIVQSGQRAQPRRSC